MTTGMAEVLHKLVLKQKEKTQRPIAPLKDTPNIIWQNED